MNKINYKKIKTSLFLVLLFTSLFSILKGIRFPGIWAVSHYFFDYSRGFIKRGLVGSFFHSILGDFYYNYNIVFYISFIIYLLSILFLFYIAFEKLKSSMNLFFPLLLFASSPAFVFYGHEIGYFDQLGLPVFCALFYFSSKIPRWFLFGIVVLVLLIFAFIHEALMLVWGGVFFILLFGVISKNKYNFKYFVIIIFFFLIIFILISRIFSDRGLLSEEEALSLHREISARVKFILRDDAFLVLSRTPKDNFLTMAERFSNPANIRFIIKSYFVNLPLFVFNFYLVWVLLSEFKLLKRILLTTLSVLMAGTVLLLHYFAWDHHRWNSIWAMNSFYILLTFTRNRKIHIDRIRIFTIVSMLVVIQLSSTNYFFDNLNPAQFPFEEHYNYIMRLILGEAKFPERP